MLCMAIATNAGKNALQRQGIKVAARGVATGGISGYIPPPKKKSAQVNFLWGKNDIRTAIQHFYTPKNLYTPQNKFLTTPLLPETYKGC